MILKNGGVAEGVLISGSTGSMLGVIFARYQKNREVGNGMGLILLKIWAILAVLADGWIFRGEISIDSGLFFKM
ncbi:MAG: hypothetical protein QM537_04870 [Candidatus Symbiobacter sp.]|nr:hypothetical protein [Candidatus Symbiobacter sp.]